MSNQPAAQGLLSALASVQQHLAGLPSDSHAGRVLRRLTTEQHAVLKRLQDRSGLTSGMFAGFLRTLDLTGCGVEARAFQRLRISEQVGRLIVGSHTHGLPALLELVRSQVLPEASGVAGIDRLDVLAALGASSEDDLLPAPARFGDAATLVPTPEPMALASVVVAAERGTVIAHGPAGVGKTTTVRSLEPYLPEGSVVVTYDCFGGGDYLSPGEDRHTPRRALVQIVNELALRLGTEPLLLSAIATEADLWRRFRHRIDEAAKALDSGAMIVIAIDAADNAAYAANLRGERSFVPDLWQLATPENVRILMTCRTHRRAEVSPPPDVAHYTLAGFDAMTSMAFLNTRFTAATAQDGQLFHERTHGVPRVQAYLLAADDSESLDALIARSEKGLHEIFEDVMCAALEERADRQAARRDIATLFAMVRPVRLPVLADVLSVTPAVGREIGASLEPGVTVTDDALHFPDEDFEHFLRDRIPVSDLRAAHSCLADYFLALCATDGVAAASVADHLKEAGRDQELIDLALSEPLPRALEDGLARAHAGKRRLTLAIDASTRIDRPESSIKLVLLAAQVVRSDSSLTTVIRTSPDLAARFADSEAISPDLSRAGGR